MCVCLRLAMTFHEMTPDILTWHASSGENFRPPVQIGLWLVHVGTAGLGLGYEIGLGLGLYAGFSDTQVARGTFGQKCQPLIHLHNVCVGKF